MNRWHRPHHVPCDLGLSKSRALPLGWKVYAWIDVESCHARYTLQHHSPLWAKVWFSPMHPRNISGLIKRTDPGSAECLGNLLARRLRLYDHAHSSSVWLVSLHFGSAFILMQRLCNRQKCSQSESESSGKKLSGENVSFTRLFASFELVYGHTHEYFGFSDVCVTCAYV